MIASLPSMQSWSCCSSIQIEGKPRDFLEPANNIVIRSRESSLSRRFPVLVCGASLVLIFSGLSPLPIRAEEKKQVDEIDENDSSIFGAIKSAFDPNERTKSGKVLPKAYLKAAREVVKTLRESLEEDPNDAAKFRRTADAAKESIREYLSNWRGQKSVLAEESYAAIEKAIRSLANFYSKAGPFATMTQDVKENILEDLKAAEDYL